MKVLFLQEVGPGDEAEESSSIDTFIMSLLWVVALEFVSFLLLLGKRFYDLNLSAKRHRVFALSVAMWQRRKLSYSAEFWIFKRREGSIATSRVKSELSFCLLASFNLRAILLVAFPFITAHAHQSSCTITVTVNCCICVSLAEQRVQVGIVFYASMSIAISPLPFTAPTAHSILSEILSFKSLKITNMMLSYG